MHDSSLANNGDLSAETQYSLCHLHVRLFPFQSLLWLLSGDIFCLQVIGIYSFHSIR
jgi:hypothetical protein